MKSLMFYLGLFLLVFLGGAHNVWAIEVPKDLTLGTSNFTNHSLGTTCFAMDALVDGLPCNPAFTAKDRKAQFQTHIFFGNNVSYVQDVTALVNNEATEENYRHLFNQTRSSEMEANVEAGFLKEKFGLSVSPYRLSYFSLVRNRSLPVVTLYAGQEQVIRGQLASFIKDDFFFGVQLRAVQRKFVAAEFTVADALVENAQDDLFVVQEQRAVYFEPGILWSPEDRRWSPQLSFVVTQLGAVDKKYEELPASPQAQLGGSLKPPVEVGELEVGTNLTLQSRQERWGDLARAAASYKIGHTQYIASFSERQYALAFMLQFQGLRGGLTYDYKNIENLIGQSEQVRTVYIQLGAEI